MRILIIEDEFNVIRLYKENKKIDVYKRQVYTTIDIPDGDYSVMLDIDYEQRLADAEPEKRAEVKRCETVQEMFDLMNNREYNDWRREHRYIDPNPKAKKMDGRKGYILSLIHILQLHGETSVQRLIE